MLAHYSGRGKTSGLELGQMRAKSANLFHVRGGKVTRFVTYFDHERALAALGLAPETGSPGSWVPMSAKQARHPFLMKAGVSRTRLSLPLRTKSRSLLGRPSY